MKTPTPIRESACNHQRQRKHSPSPSPFTSTTAKLPGLTPPFRCKHPYSTQHELAPCHPFFLSCRSSRPEFSRKKEGKPYINHCSVLNLTPSTLSRNPATSCSILVSVSLIFSSCPLASSLIRPFSRFRSNLTLAWARPTSSRRRDASLAMSLLRRSCEARVTVVSLESAWRSSERSLVKSTLEE